MLDLSSKSATNALGLNYVMFDETDGSGSCTPRVSEFYDTSVLL